MKRKSPTQTERLMRALLAGRRVDRPYALNVLRIAHPGARVGEIRAAWDEGYVWTMLEPFKQGDRILSTVRKDGHFYYTIPPAYRKEVREWWNGRAGK